MKSHGSDRVFFHSDIREEITKSSQTELFCPSDPRSPAIFTLNHHEIGHGMTPYRITN